MKYTKQIFGIGLGLQFAVMTPFLMFDIITEPWWVELIIIANAFWVGRLVSYYYRHVKGRCISCGHGDYYHIVHNIEGRSVPSCFHKKGHLTGKEWIQDTVPYLGLSSLGPNFNFCRCENYVSKSTAIERIKKTRIEP